MRGVQVLHGGERISDPAAKRSSCERGPRVEYSQHTAARADAASAAAKVGCGGPGLTAYSRRACHAADFKRKG